MKVVYVLWQNNLALADGVRQGAQAEAEDGLWFSRHCQAIVKPVHTSKMAQEGSTLQSALCAALSSTGCPWPAVIPVHDPLRDACWGVAVTCTAATAFLDSDSVHLSNLPDKLLRVSN